MPRLFNFKRKGAATPQKVQRITRTLKHPAVAVPLITFFSILVATAAALIILGGGTPQLRTTDTKVVIITHDDVEQSLPTRARTVAEVLKRAEIAIKEGDVVEPGLETPVVSDNFRINVYRAVPVTIVDGGKKTFAFTAAKTPRSIVKESGIEVYPEDNLLLIPAENFLLEGSIGERVVIERAVPVNLNIYGTQVMMRTRAKTVADLIVERKIHLQPGDTLQPGPATAITPNLQVFLLRVGQRIESVEEVVLAPRVIQEDENLSFGTKVTRQQGSDGKKIVTYQVDINTGERKKIQEVVIVEPVAFITAQGKAVQIPADKQAVMRSAGIVPGDYPYVDFVISHESGWCPTKLQGQIGYCPPYAPETIPSSKGYGLGQATPGTKMAAFGADWKTSAVTQLKWADSYAKGRYGTWRAAYDFWQNRHYW